MFKNSRNLAYSAAFGKVSSFFGHFLWVWPVDSIAPQKSLNDFIAVVAIMFITNFGVDIVLTISDIFVIGFY